MLDKRFEDRVGKVIIEKKSHLDRRTSYIVICDGNTFRAFLRLVRITNEYMTMIKAPIPGVWDPLFPSRRI